MGLMDRFRANWNGFFSYETAVDRNPYYQDFGPSSSTRPDQRSYYRPGTERSIINAIQTRIAIDVAAVSIRHVLLDENDRYSKTVSDGLNYCLTVEANKDQTGREFIQDLVQSCCDEGYVAVIPFKADVDPFYTETYSIESVRVGKIVAWYPDHVKVNLYNEDTGKNEDVIYPKRLAAIIQNPLYDVMNRPNSNLQRLKKKIATMDAIDDQLSVGKLDLIVQLPYPIRSEARRALAEERRKDIEQQLIDSKYGVAYADGTEKIVQLNRPLENNLLQTIQYLYTQTFNQLGITEAVFNGTANEQEMLNYYNRTIEPFLGAIANEFSRKWLSKNARSRGHTIMYFNDPFRLIPVSQVADMADKFTRNEIMSTNEFRAILGMKGVPDQRADELRNKNINQSPDAEPPVNTKEGEEGYYEEMAPNGGMEQNYDPSYANAPMDPYAGQY